MGKALERSVVDRAAYFEWEAAQAAKNEYLRGEVFAMVGAHQDHVLVSLTLAARLREHLRGSRCRAYTSDMKLEVVAADAVFYPDVMVSCDEVDRAATLALRAPKLVVEVLSESTAAYDRGPKFAVYRQLESLQEYLLVDIEARRLELYTRSAATQPGTGTAPPASWLLTESRAADPAVQLQSVRLRLTVAEVFEDLAAG
jgi:Uma2 family endonuclease